jgi:hypothetical protein
MLAHGSEAPCEDGSLPFRPGAGKGQRAGQGFIGDDGQGPNVPRWIRFFTQ